MKVRIVKEGMRNRMLTIAIGLWMLILPGKVFPQAASVHVGDSPLTTPTISGEDTCCKLSQQTYTTEANKTNYIWTVSTGGQVVGGGTTGHNWIEILWNDPGAQSVSVSYDQGTGTGVLDIWIHDITSVAVTISASQNPVCAGGQVVFTAVPVNGGDPDYQWYVNSSPVGSNQPTFTYIPTNGQQVWCTMVSTTVCPASSPVVSNTVVMTVYPYLEAGITIVANPNPSCTGSPVSCTATPVNGGSNPFYQWKVNGENTGTNSPLLSFVPTNGDIVTCTLTSSELCSTGNPKTSLPVTLQVNPLQPVSVTISGSNHVCEGENVTYTANAVNPGINPSYNWKVNGISVFVSSSTIWNHIPVNGEIITCELTSGAACASGNPAVSNAIVMEVDPYVAVSVTAASSVNPSCNGELVTYTATPVNGGVVPGFQWMRNGSPVGTGASTYSYTPDNNDQIYCILNSGLLCKTGNPATSNTIIQQVSPVVTPSISMSSSATSVCEGTSVTLEVTSQNGGGAPTYQWLVNGIPVTGPSTIYTYTPVNGDIVKCIMTSSSTCAFGVTVADSVILTVNPVLPVSVSIAANINPVCSGNSVLLTATPNNGGLSPGYEWKVNGVVTGSSNPVLSYIPVDNDIITCLLTSSEACTSGNPALSNQVTMGVSSVNPVSVSITASKNPICNGENVTFTATAVNGGTSPVFSWLSGALPLGAGPVITTNALTNGAVVTCILNSNAGCTTGNPATSNAITMVVNPTVAVGVTISSSKNPSCTGDQVIFQATPMNGGSTPVYQWKVNGVNAGTNAATFAYTPANNDLVSCQMVSSTLCPNPSVALSNSISQAVQVYKTAGITISANENPICTGSQATITALPVNGGASPMYQWYLGSQMAGSSPLFIYTPNPGTDSIRCRLTSSELCVSNNPVMSDTLFLVTATPLPGSLTISTNQNPFCAGDIVSFTAQPVNPGSAPVYQWKVNGVNAGSNSTSFSYLPAHGDVVSCVMTSSYICSLGPAWSNPILMTALTNKPAGVAIVASQNPACTGTSVTFTATPQNPGTAPSYQWLVNSAPVSGATESTYSYIPDNNDTVRCRMTSNEPCVFGSPALSAKIIMSMNAGNPASVLITPSTNPFCLGSAVTLTATPVNGGGTPAFEWFKNSVSTGATGGSYTYSPADNDQVYCQMTSSSACVTGPNPVNSNTVIMDGEASLTAAITITPALNPVCDGMPVTLTSTVANGGSNPTYEWKVNGIVTGGNTPMLTYIPENEDQVTCEFTSDLICATNNPALSNVVTILVDTLPPVATIAASSNPVCQGDSVTLTASVVNGGSSIQYSWRLNGNPAGTNSPVFKYLPTHNDDIYCLVTGNSPCSSVAPVISNHVAMVVHAPAPVGVTVTGNPNPFCPGELVTFTAIPSNGGTAPAYQWKVNGSVVTGATAATYAFHPVGGEMVTCQVTSNASCITGNPATSAPVIATLNTGTTVSVTITVNINSICPGNIMQFTATPVNGGTPFYQWRRNGIPVGTNHPIFSYAPTAPDTIVCKVTSSLPCVVGNPATSNAIIVSILPQTSVSVTVTPSANPSCLGDTVIYQATATNCGSNPSYMWFINGGSGIVGTSVFKYKPNNNDKIQCRVTPSPGITCPQPNYPTAFVIMTVLPITPAIVNITASANPVCEGTLVTYTASPTNGGTAPSYQWKVNGIAAGTNSTQFQYTPVNGDIITCDMLSNAFCVTNQSVVSNTIVMSVLAYVPAGVTISTPVTGVCQGTAVTLTASPLNGGAAPSYQWIVNGLNAGTNSALFTYTPANEDSVSCVMTSNRGCTTGNPASSDTVGFTVASNLPVSVSIAASSMPQCQGQSITYTASPVNQGLTPVYQWKVNGGNAGTNSPTYTYVPQNGQVISCILTSSLSCVTGNPAISNSIAMNFQPALNASVSISASQNPSCEGTSVTMTAVPVNGGTTPAYQWKVNGVNTGSNSDIFSYVPTNNDLVTCVLTSSVACPVANPVTSNMVTLTVQPWQTMTLSISASKNPVCTGDPVTFTATTGSSGSYSWRVNGSSAGLNQPTYTYTPADGDIVECILTSGNPCTTNNPVTSNQVIMGVSNSLPASVSIIASQNPACAGQQVTFTAQPVNGGIAPAYAWYKGNQIVGTNSATYTGVPVDGDLYYCVMESDLTCATGSPAISDTITMNVNPLLTAGITVSASPNPACTGSTVVYSTSITNGGVSPQYQWLVNGIQVGATLPTYSNVPLNGDQISCILVSSEMCAVNSPVTSLPESMIIGSAFNASVTIVASDDQLCENTPVTLTATGTFGGSNPQYQWQVNGLNVGPNAPVYNYFPSNGDIVRCLYTSSLSCVLSNPDTSNSILLSVLPIPIGATSGMVPSTPVCAGELVTFTCYPQNGGSNPTYGWKVNGISTGPNAPDFTYAPAHNDIVTCTMTSNATCASGNTATTAPLVAQVNPLMPVSVTIAASDNNVCDGTTVNYTATVVNGGGSPVFQWQVNGINAGTNTSVFSYIPVNNDVIRCVVTSDITCPSGNPAASNEVTMMVNPVLPVSVTISESQNSVCDGTSVSFTATPVNGGATPQYQWKVNGSNAGSNLPLFSYMPANNDIVTCELISDALCPAGNPAISNPVTMVVLPLLPVNITITGSQQNVCAGTQVSFTATPVNGGTSPVYQWKVNGVNAGTNDPVFSYIPVDSDMVECELTSDAPCPTGSPAISNAIVMTVNPLLPVSISVTESQNNVCAGTNVVFTATSINGGANPVYQWQVNGVNAGSNSTTYGYVPGDGDVVICSLVSDALCPTGNPAVSNAVTMTVQPVSPVSITIVESQNNVCEGTLITFNATAVNGGPDPMYQWKVNGMNAGANSSLYSYIPVNGDQVICTLLSNATCPTGNPAVSNTIVMTVNPMLPVSLSIVASQNDVCEGTLVDFTATPVNGGMNPAYQWQVNGLNAGGNNPLFTFTPLNGDVITCTLLSDEGCTTGNPAQSNPITMVVNPLLPVGVTITASNNSICEGTSVTFTATPVNGGANPVYDWQVNSNVTVSVIPVFSHVPVNGDIVTCILHSDAACATGDPAVSNPVTMVVNPLLPVSVSIAESENNVCAGTLVSFTATPVNGGPNPVFQWTVNGGAAGANSPSFSYTPVQGDVVGCTLISDAICPTGNPAVSNTITMTVNPLLPVSIFITESLNPVCAGTEVQFTATPVNGGSGAVYQWHVNGLGAGSNSPVFMYTPDHGDVVTCRLISDEACATGNPAISNAITMTVNPLLPVAISIAASANSVCVGTSVSYTATPVNGGSTPHYQWQVNGTNAGADDALFSYTPVNGDIVTCTLTSAATCPTGNPAFSNAIVMTVNPLLPVGITISPDVNPVCDGTTVLFSASVINGGSNPSYQWFRNGTAIGSNNATLTDIPNDGDEYRCMVTSNALCATGSPSLSAPVTMSVLPNLPVSVTIIPSQPAVCEGTSVTFTAMVNNGGAIPHYQWKVNGINAGSDNVVFIYIPANNDQVTCEATSSESCVTGNPATSNTITMIVHPVMPAGVSISATANQICAATSVTFTAAPVNGGTLPVYQWYLNGLAVSGASNSNYIDTPADGDLVYCEMISNLVCVSGNPAISGTIEMEVYPLLPVDISISADANSVCEGSVVNFTAQVTNGGLSPVYQWSVGGIPQGANSPVFTYGPQNNDIITCQVTSDAVCAINNPAVSQPLIVTVNPLMPVSVSIAPDINPVCAGTPVTFSATPVNGGPGPMYQWHVNGVVSGTNSPVFTFTPIDGDVVTCELVSDILCPTGNPAMSNPVVLTVLPVTPVSVTVIASPSVSVCAGTQVTFTATAINGGPNPGYQWKVNGLNTGGTTSVYMYIPQIGDVVICEVTSGLACPGVNPVSSAPLTIQLSPSPVVTLQVCNDIVTTTDAQPFRLKGGLPLGGDYSGPGVNTTTGYFNPAGAGPGSHQVVYTYTNAGNCFATASVTILVNPAPVFSCGDVYTDPRDSRSYPTVSIGTQCWMAANLDYGSMTVFPASQGENCMAEKYCFNNSATQCASYGGLYQWNELMHYESTSGIQGLCPPGWHIPSSAEWQQLFAHYGGQSQAATSLKDPALPSAFMALMPGIAVQNNQWAYAQPALSVTFFWTSDLAGAYKATAHGLNNKTGSVSDYHAPRANGYSVRCLRD